MDVTLAMDMRDGLHSLEANAFVHFLMPVIECGEDESLDVRGERS